MHRDSELVAGFLRAEEAEMLCELLASHGIDAWMEGAIASVLGPLLPGAGGGARLLVLAGDAARAREIVATSGLFRGEAAAPVEIPEHAWAAPPGPGAHARGEPEAAAAGWKTFLLYPVVVLAFVIVASALCLSAGR